MAVRDLILGRGRRGLVVRVAALVLLATLALAYAVWPRPATIERAVGLLPEDAQRVLWTDWAALRQELSCGDLTACADEAADRDLSTPSSLLASAEALQSQFDWGPMTVGWETLGQGTSGQLLVVGGLGEERLETIAEAYEEHGFIAPSKGRLDGGVWTGGADLLARIGISETLFSHVAFLGDEGVLLSSDDPDYLADAVAGARTGDGPALPLPGSVDDAIAAVGLAGDRACEELAFATADSGAQAEAEQLVEAAGGVSPLDGYLVALGPDDAWAAVLGFEDDRRAERDLLPRQRLAAGTDPGQAGSYPELFTLESAETDGSSVVLRGKARPSAYALTQTTQGPVLLATC